MVDPVNLIAIGAAVGGAAGKFTEKVWDFGEKWITSYYKDHGEQAQEKAKENSLAFITDLAHRLKATEEQNQENAEEIKNALSHPGFSALLQKTILASAETDNKEKHEILSRLVADRLTKDPESIHALTCKMATDAISSMNKVQLKLLALNMNLRSVVPNGIPEAKNQDQFDQFAERWIGNRMEKLVNFKFSNLDLEHLEALSCLTNMRIGSSNLKALFENKFSENAKAVYKFNFEKFIKSKTGKAIGTHWSNGLKSAVLTSVGQLIGIYATEMITGSPTNLSPEWK